MWPLYRAARKRARGPGSRSSGARTAGFGPEVFDPHPSTLENRHSRPAGGVSDRELEEPRRWVRSGTEIRGSRVEMGLEPGFHRWAEIAAAEYPRVWRV